MYIERVDSYGYKQPKICFYPRLLACENVDNYLFSLSIFDSGGGHVVAGKGAYF